MGSIQTVQSKGIYHGLPVFSPEIKGLTAVVTGASGISGSYMLKVLSESPERWTKVYALSRKPPAGKYGPNVQHVPVDFLGNGAEGIADKLKEFNIKPDVVFFYAYIQPSPPKDGAHLWSNLDEMVRINVLLLDNFLEALVLADAIPNRILLQLGAKYYGVHLGPAKVPQEEDDPRVESEPNFYYPQEDHLIEFSKKHNIGWNTTRPASIPGAVPDAAMNLCLPLAIYATVQQHLGLPLEYPSDIVAWEMTEALSSAQMNSYEAEWIVLTDKAKNESFNSCDGSAFAWGGFWPKMAKWFGVGFVYPDADLSKYKETPTAQDPPPRGFGGATVMRTRWTMAEWARKPEVIQAWKAIAERHGLAYRELKDTDRLFGFTDNSLMWSYPSNFSTTKLRRLGFHGYVDTAESIHQVFNEFVELNMIPKVFS